ncbi:Monocarboxylate transporter 12 [Sarcoptes scabiei]|uniref:Monocarboxylate transporter 12 n=1 Tax=Sarcoptes scabiei TaxID=52283 RepID=A0A834R6L6_SARSC|nr:Monocarboxylate transporter 12 [Sarcoptes scabiei]
MPLMKSMSLQEPSSTQSDLQNPPSIVISSDLELRDRDGSALDDDDEIKDEKFFLNDENPGGSFSPPDGGFGWIVVFASFMCNVIVDGIIFSFGILLPKISSEFDESKATTAWIGSLQTGFYLIVGPLVSALAQRYDCRIITSIGSVLAASGFALSYFAPNVLTLYATFGILGGIGFGFIFLPAIVTVGFYFEKRRAFATGIAVCGSGVGTFVMPPIIHFLVEQFGWRLTVLFLAGMSLFCVGFGALFKPLLFDAVVGQNDQHKTNGPEPKPLLIRIKEARAAQWACSEEAINEQFESPTGSQNSAPPPYSEVLNIIPLTPKTPTTPPTPFPFNTTQAISFSKTSLNYKTTPMNPEIKENRFASSEMIRKQSKVSGQFQDHRYSSRDEMLYSNLSLVVIPQSRSYANNLHQTRALSITSIEFNEVRKDFLSGFDLSLLKRPSFVLLALSGFLCLVGFFIPFIYLSDRAKLLGCSPEKCAFILSVIGITNTLGRVICGWASDSRVNALMVNNIALTLGGLATIMSPIVFNSYYLLIFYGSVFGLSVASFATLRSVITVELLGLEKLTSAFGLLLLFQGLAVTIGSPIAGWFFDITGSYDYSFYLSGTAILLSGVMCYPLNAIASWEKKYFDSESLNTGNDDDDHFDEKNIENGNAQGLNSSYSN